VIGVTVGLAMSRLLDPLLFGLSSRDPRVLATVAGALLLVVVVASYVPAFRATRINPPEALREL
jgi:ABC-type antimicrobial peptide transport system permease subunit